MLNNLKNLSHIIKGGIFLKKILGIILVSFTLVGCSLGEMDNTPTKKVESYLNEYQTLDLNVLNELDSIVNQEVMFDDNQKSEYRDILKKHYQDLTYMIKEETVNADKATVEVEIEVNDYTKTLKTAEGYKESNKEEFMDESGEFNETKFNDYKLELLKSNKERVEYTLYFSLTKKDKEWILDDLTESEQEKILGIYEY